jgi:hypothetical protein
MSWEPPPKRAAWRKTTASTPSTDRYDSELATDAQLAKRTKEELMIEVQRLQRTLFSCAMELGLRRRSQSGECVISPQFAHAVSVTIDHGLKGNLR